MSKRNLTNPDATPDWSLSQQQRTAVDLITVGKNLQETADAIAELRGARLPVGGVIVNQVRPQDLDADDLAAIRADTVEVESLVSDLKSAGIEAGDEVVTGLLAEARDHAERRALEDAQRELVRGFDVPTYELPRLPGGADLGGLYELAAELKKQGMA